MQNGNENRIVKRYKRIKKYFPVYLANGTFGGCFGVFGTQQESYSFEGSRIKLKSREFPFTPYIYHDRVWNSVGERVPLGNLGGYFGNNSLEGPNSFGAITDLIQELNLGQGILITAGRTENKSYRTETIVHKDRDLIYLNMSTEDPGIEKTVFFNLKYPFEKKLVIYGKNFITICAKMEGWSLAVCIGTSKDCTYYDDYTSIGLKAKTNIEVYVAIKVGKLIADRNRHKEMIKDVEYIVKDARNKGGTHLKKEQTDAWNRFWQKSSIKIPDAKLMELYQASLFYLGQSISDVSVSPVGLASNWWHGHRFCWDEFLMHWAMCLSNHLKEAGKIFSFRNNTLHQAERLAAEIGVNGAVYPAESGGRGIERAVSPFLYQHEATSLSAAMVAYNQYFFSGKIETLRDAYSVLKQVANYLKSIVVLDKKTGKYGLGVSFSEARETFGLNPVEPSGAVKKGLDIFCHAARILNRDPKLCTELGKIVKKWRLPNDGKKYIFFEREWDKRGCLIKVNKDQKVRCSGQIDICFPFQVIHQSDPLLPATIDDVRHSLNYPVLPAFHLGNLVVVENLIGKVDWALGTMKMISGIYEMSHGITSEIPPGGALYFITSSGTFITAILSFFFYSTPKEIFLFHAVPKKWKDLSFWDLRTHNGLLVSGDMKKGYVHRISIKNTSNLEVVNELYIDKLNKRNTYLIQKLTRRKKVIYERRVKNSARIKMRINLPGKGKCLIRRLKEIC